MKKIIGILIAVAILATCMAANVYAASGTITVGTKEIEASKAGSEVTLYVTNEQPITSFTMSLDFDSELELVSVVNGGVAGSSFNNYGSNVAGWANANETYPAGSILFKVTFKVPADAQPGDFYNVGLTMNSNGGIYDADRNEVAFAPVAGGIKVKEDPTQPSEEPTKPSEEPTKPSEEPTKPSEEPTKPSDEPTKPSEHEHSYTKTVKAPTCTEKGYTLYKCACGDSYKADFVNALGHYYKDANGKLCYEFNDTVHWLVCQRKGCGHCDVAEKHEHDQQHGGYWWCVCGHRGPAVKKPIHNGDYDDVPQTGDITGYVTFGAVAVISMAAAAAYVVSRKVAKK